MKTKRMIALAVLATLPLAGFSEDADSLIPHIDQIARITLEPYASEFTGYIFPNGAALLILSSHIRRT